MNQLTTTERTAVLAALVEGNSIRATVRITGAAKNTVVKLLADVGSACAQFQDEALRNLPCKRIQCDEIWSFCYAKEKNVPARMRGKPGVGDVWTWTALCADTKLVPCWLIGGRDAGCANQFMHDLASRLTHRIQLTTDGHRVYLNAVAGAFLGKWPHGHGIDYAMLVKLYGTDRSGEARYSPAICKGCQQEAIYGSPDPQHVSTSFVERQNLTMRMQMRRFTRLTNAFSKKIDNLRHAVALHFMHYNFCRIHQTLKTTPAVAAGVADHIWRIEEIVDLLARTSN